MAIGLAAGAVLWVRRLALCRPLLRVVRRLWQPCSRWLAVRRTARAREKFWSQLRAGQREAEARRPR